MKLVVAEKPSVMRDIAAVLGATKKNAEGALCGNGYMVTSARGHFLRLKKPEEYDERYSKWDIATLPILPDFEFVPVENAEKELVTLGKLMNSGEVDEIIEATDAGREGECIFRYIYDYVGCRKPVSRLWISSMTEAAIRDGFENLKPASDYDTLFAAGLARNKLDWLWGINLTRLYTDCFGVKFSIGRVRTAVLNMLVQREKEHNAFTKQTFFKLTLNDEAVWFDGDTDTFPTKTAAEAIYNKCMGKSCKVISVKRQRKKQNRPLLFSLTSLQVEANEKLGFSAAKTLSIMQTLYEKKLLTYPRTDSNYLTDDMAAILPERVNMVREYNEEIVDMMSVHGLNIDSRVINNSKVSDHHAIIPTENIAQARNMELTRDETGILELVLNRFLEALSAPYEYDETEYIFDIGGETFKQKLKVPVNLGWKMFEIDDEDVDTPLNYAEGDTVSDFTIKVEECETTPPKRYTESALLKAMENIDRRIEDKELSEYVSERGLGTPATRAMIIEKILSDEYAVRKGKTIIPTETGIQMIDLLPEAVKSIEMTATMELQLSAVQNGSVSADEVIGGIISKIKSIIETEKSKEHISLRKAPPKVSLGKCPKCGGNVYKFVRDNTAVYYCENAPKSCIFRIYEDDRFFTSKKKRLTEDIVKTLLKNGEVKMTGLWSEKTGKTYDGIIFFKDRTDNNKNLKVGYEMRFENKPKKKGGK